MLITTTDELLRLPSKTMIDVKCDVCNKDFHRQQKYLKRDILIRNFKHQFCSLKCVGSFYKKIHQVICKTCGKSFQKKNSEITRSPNSFCNASCAATYNNIHKTYGYSRSKFELFVEKHLLENYKNLEFSFCNRKRIKAELDIYIPSLELAFEINGIFHYKPIFGEENLQKIMNKDLNKVQTCLRENIKLYVIDISSMGVFSEEESQQYLNIITNIINSECKEQNKLVGLEGYDPSTYKL